MISESDQISEERDSLHILPLTTVPLTMPSLQNARLVKNVGLESMIELYSGKETGSGQINAGDLAKSFDFSGEKAADLAIVRSVCKLSSYDVYSLRISLRKLGINVEEHENLRLSPAMTAKLAGRMKVFTRPLIASVYGDAAKNAETYQDMLKLFMSPDQGEARTNLNNLSKMLEISIMDIPSFLQDYGDVYLSLAYYQYCIDSYNDQMLEFFEWLNNLRLDPLARANGQFNKVSAIVETAIKNTTEEVRHILEMFESRTADMWDDPSADKFQAMRRLVFDYQCQIGGALCAVSVKLDAWSTKFRAKGPGSTQNKIDFILSEMRYGLEKLERIDYSDTPQ